MEVIPCDIDSQHLIDVNVLVSNQNLISFVAICF